MEKLKTIRDKLQKILSVCSFDNVESFDYRPQIRGPATPKTPGFREGPPLTPGVGYSRFETSEGLLTPGTGYSRFDVSEGPLTPDTVGFRFDTSEGPLTPGTGRSRFDTSLRPPTPGTGQSRSHLGRSHLDDSEGSVTITPGTKQIYS